MNVVLRTRRYEQVLFKQHIRMENVGFRNIRKLKMEETCATEHVFVRC